MANLNSKKKAELIDIILRKDNVERGLRADIEGMEKQLGELKEQMSELDMNLGEVENAYEVLNDEHHQANAEIYSLKNRVKRLRRRNYLWFGLAVISIITATLLMCFS